VWCYLCCEIIKKQEKDEDKKLNNDYGREMKIKIRIN